MGWFKKLLRKWILEIVASEIMTSGSLYHTIKIHLIDDRNKFPSLSPNDVVDIVKRSI